MLLAVSALAHCMVARFVNGRDDEAEQSSRYLGGMGMGWRELMFPAEVLHLLLSLPEAKNMATPTHFS
jgi:hypothetical protein